MGAAAACLGETEAPVSEGESEFVWGYTEETGPKVWAQHFCDARGTKQSPIDVDVNAVLSGESTQVESPTVNVRYLDCMASVENNGLGVKWSVQDAGGVDFNENFYKLVQFHYHIPSEHSFSGHLKELEIHFVHQHEESGELLVLGHLYEFGAANDFLSNVIQFRPLKVGESKKLSQRIEFSKLIGFSEGKFIHYQGSLTTPPCSEGVQWFVNPEVQKISFSQVAWFESCVPCNNSRPVQPMNGRTCCVAHVGLGKRGVNQIRE